jgi:predicted ATP-grasp superfamily ATP-dependent carboligase
MTDGSAAGRPDRAIEIHSHPDLDSPLLLIALEGWIDAGSAGDLAVQAITAELNPTLMATFDPDTFIDYRARRPTLHIRDGVNTGLTWPELTMLYAKDRHGSDLLILRGPEPDMAWFRFCALVRELALSHGVRLAVAMGAYPVAVPHTRRSVVACTASEESLANGSGLLRNSVDVPAGASAAIERTLNDAGIGSIGLWAQVPHYATAMPYPAGSVSLLDALQRVGGIEIDRAPLLEAARGQRTRLDELVSQSAEHAAMVQQLEAGYDAEHAAPEPPTSSGGFGQPGTPLPSGDELAAELEQFLREQGD